MLTISTSFGDPWIVGTHTRNRAKTDERSNTIAQNIRRCIIPTKRAHKTDQTDQPSPGTDQSDIKTHQAETQMKAVARGGHRGSADPTWQRLRLSFGGNVILILQKVVVKVPIIVDGRNRPLELYKGPPHTLSRHSHSPLHSFVGEVVVGLHLYH